MTTFYKRKLQELFPDRWEALYADGQGKNRPHLFYRTVVYHKEIDLWREEKLAAGEVGRFLRSIYKNEKRLSELKENRRRISMACVELKNLRKDNREFFHNRNVNILTDYILGVPVARTCEREQVKPDVVYQIRTRAAAHLKKLKGFSNILWCIRKVKRRTK